jgi:hypothetical protein
LIFEQIARAMEVFAIAHEYGHHDLNHGRALSGDAHAEEFEADQFALRICYEVEQRPYIFPNPYLSSGAGGVALLTALGTLRTVERALGASEPMDQATHPSVAARVERFNSVALLKPAEYGALQGFRLACSRILIAVHAEITLALKAMSSKTLAELRREVSALQSGMATEIDGR